MTEQPKITKKDIATLAATVRAPESLHRRVQEMIAEAQQRPARRRIGWWMPTGRLAVRTTPAVRPLAAAAAAALAAALAIVLAVALSGGGSGGAGPQTLSTRAAALALAPATLPAPPESSSNRRELAASVGGVAFPYWEEHFGWHASGSRRDTLAGHSVTTVFYSNANGQRVGYAIVAGRAPATPDGRLIRHWGVPYRLSVQDGANVIVWRRHGRLCVVAARGVSHSTLLSLASWDGGASRAA